MKSTALAGADSERISDNNNNNNNNSQCANKLQIE